MVLADPEGPGPGFCMVFLSLGHEKIPVRLTLAGHTNGDLVRVLYVVTGRLLRPPCEWAATRRNAPC